MPNMNLPDFEDLFELAQVIGRLKMQVELDKNRLDILLAEITDVTSSNERYFVNGKPPSMSYTESNYHKIGYDGQTRQELENLRHQIAVNSGQLEEKRLVMDLYKDMIDVWRTESANERSAIYDGV